jgi:alpha-mannosidase
VRRPRLHLICTAHLDPVWQWNWEEGASEAMATFATAAKLLRGHPGFIFNHNEALLYRWVERYDPVLFREIRRLVREGRWSVSGGWYLQPDVNMPGLESLVRQVTEGRRYFEDRFGARPLAAYNFDSFGHGGGLPQVLRLAGYKMYIHMRPQKAELELPADLFRWRGVDGSEVLTLRIEVGLYHTERDNLKARLEEAAALAVALGRDVPVFWGLGDHGGGATQEDLARIDEFRAKERRVEVLHSTPDQLYEALAPGEKRAPVVAGDLQRVFTGCYTSLSRVKRRAEESLGVLVQTEALRAASWWLASQPYPETELAEAWRDHLFNDFHDILSGSCTEPAERDALDLYGRAIETSRRMRLGAARALNPGAGAATAAPIPITVLNTNPSLAAAPVEVECLADYRPMWTGEWHLRVFGSDGREVECQEEQPESLLPWNWRKKLCFIAKLEGVGASHYVARAEPGRHGERARPAGPKSELKYKIDRKSGFLAGLRVAGSPPFLRGPLLEPLVIRDPGDSWGTDVRRYRNIEGRFALIPKSLRTIEDGPVRTITESVLAYRGSRIVVQTVGYPDFPALEFRLRIHWNEARRMLKLAVPTALRRASLLVEVPGGAIARPADGEEHVFGRWAVIEGEAAGRRQAVAVIGSGQHGLDFRRGELRLSVLRSAAYCHERNFPLSSFPARKYMDQGVHDVRLLITAGEPAEVLNRVSSLADWLNMPPWAVAHLPFDYGTEAHGSEIPLHEETDDRGKGDAAPPLAPGFLTLSPPGIRLTCLKRSADRRALILRLQETRGLETGARLDVSRPRVSDAVRFRPFEIKTLRLEKDGRLREVDLVREKGVPSRYTTKGKNVT